MEWRRVEFHPVVFNPELGSAAWGFRAARSSIRRMVRVGFSIFLEELESF
jgi:hypothetical protein